MDIHPKTKMRFTYLKFFVDKNILKFSFSSLFVLAYNRIQIQQYLNIKFHFVIIIHSKYNQKTMIIIIEKLREKNEYIFF